jgi:TonB-linked SusC/RagA family outer membrane protein
MRKLVSLLLMAVLCSMLVFAQSRSITGTVTDANGKPVPFASVTVKGTKNGVTADAEGKFILKNVGAGATLTITSVGFENREVSVGSNETVSVSLTATNTGDLKEVVVTSAFGIKKSSRVTPFSTQVIKDEQLKIIPQTNINNALAGKVAGTQYRGQSPIKLDNEGGFRVRGGQGLTDAGPIYVVDGTIVGSFDINPDDVEEVNFLKGANATALFGGRASNGAVVVTTKKRGEKGSAGIEVSQGVTFDKVYVLPKYQNRYAGGGDANMIQFTWQAGMPVEWQALNGKYYHEFTDDASWGPRMDGQEYIPWYAFTPGHKYSFQTASLTPQPNNARDFWNTGTTTVTNVSFSKAGQGYNARLSYTNNSVDGMLLNTAAEKHTVFGAFSVDLNQHFRAGLNISVVHQKIRGTFDDDYANQSQGSFNQWFHRDLDMDKMRELRWVRTPNNTYPSWNLRSNPASAAAVNNVYIGNYWYNFFAWFENVNFKQIRDRAFGDVYLAYKLNNDFTVKATVRKSLLNIGFENIIPSIIERSAGQAGIFASYATGQRRIDEMNYELIAMYNHKFLGKLDVSATVGGNWMRFKDVDQTMATVQGLNVPDLYSIANSKAQPAITNPRLREEQRSVFASGDFEWDRTVSLSWALRNDWYSTLFGGENSLLSPSLGAGFVFSEFTKKSLPWLSFGKVFASWGKKPTALGINNNNFLYGVNPNQWAGNFLMTTPNRLVDPATKGALITTIETGLDLRFLRNRLGVSVTYYNEDIDKAPVTVNVYGASGFLTKVLNAAHIKRQGIEVVLNARPIAGKNFTWEISKTFGYLIKNPVVSIADGVPRFLLAQSAFTTVVPRVFLEEGQEWGQLIGGAIARNEEGVPMLNANGLFAREDNHHFGSVVPKTTGGITNTLTYKNFTFNFFIDYQIGGKFFSLSEMWGHYSGLLEATAATNDKGNNVRDDIADGGGVHVVGVSVIDGKTPVDMYIDAQTYFHQFYNNVYDPYVHDLTYVKLREVSLGYQFPVSKWKVGKILKAATFSIVARNPWLIHRKTKNFDPSEISEIQGEDGQYPGTRALGFNLKLNF